MAGLAQSMSSGSFKPMGFLQMFGDRENNKPRASMPTLLQGIHGIQGLQGVTPPAPPAPPTNPTSLAEGARRVRGAFRQRRPTIAGGGQGY